MSAPCAVETCDRPARALHLCRTHYRRLRGGRVPLDAPIQTHPAPARYESVHSRLAYHRGPARAHKCPCGAQAFEWCYDHLDPAEITAPARDFLATYSLDLDHYMALCRRCHRALDRAARAGLIGPNRGQPADLIGSPR